jgi:hypothetical protein
MCIGTLSCKLSLGVATRYNMGFQPRIVEEIPKCSYQSGASNNF